MKDPHVIVTIVRKGWGDTVLEATMKKGAHGGTILGGRGIGRNELQKVFGIQIEPEKEIVLTVVPGEIRDTLLNEIVSAAQLNTPGNGLAFSLPLEKVVGIVHLINAQTDAEQ